MHISFGTGPDLNLALGLISFGCGTCIALDPLPILFLHPESSAFLSVEMQPTIVTAEKKRKKKEIRKKIKKEIKKNNEKKNKKIKMKK